MSILSLIIAPLFALQGVGQAPVAIKNDDPETWTLEYPRIIRPQVENYRRCLVIRMRRVTGEANFEEQHRSDVVACAQELTEAKESALQALSRFEVYADYDDQRVSQIFENVGRIHIARGADLDSQFTYVLRRSEQNEAQYAENRPKGLVLELHDASVVKARTDATAAAAEAALRERLEQQSQTQQESRGAPN